MYPLILAFHKIIPDNLTQHSYFWKPLCTSYTDFVSFIESLYQENFAFISLHDLEYARMKPKEKTVLLTFDDGYYNNVAYAYPLLKAEKIPFIVALNGKCMETQTWQWFDRIWYEGIRTQRNIEQTIAQIQTFKYDIPALEKWLDMHPNPESKTETERIFFDIATVEELKTLHNVSFVSHTYSHYILTALSQNGLEKELSQNRDFFSRNDLKSENGYFILPNGTKKDFNSQTTNFLIKMGTEYIFSMLPYTHDMHILARYTPTQPTWQKEKKRYTWQRLIHKWLY
jgi:peptidoglycan/xylan/chitin deacetylase (PgdA/CDA1 family)